MRRLSTNLLGVLIIYGASASASYAQEAVGARTGAFTHKVLLRDMVTPNTLENLSHVYEPDQIMSWNIYVPPDYNPQNPPGLWVYISPSKKGYLSPKWKTVISDHNFIFISANGAGNKVPTNQRITNALLAARYIDLKYTTDQSRTVISGFSGGARVSSIITETVSDIFEAGIFMGGARQWEGDTASIHPTLKDGAYVFITGRDDQARREVRKTYNLYKKAGLEHVKLIDEHNMGHELPKSKIIRQALDFIAAKP